jgi:hypothetical protein
MVAVSAGAGRDSPNANTKLKARRMVLIQQQLVRIAALTANSAKPSTKNSNIALNVISHQQFVPLRCVC